MAEFQLNFLFQTAAEGILLTDHDGLLQRINPAAAAMLRLSPDEALGQPTTVLFKQRPDLVRLLTQRGEQQADLLLPHKRLATGVGVDCPGGGRIVLLNDVTERADLDSRREALIRSIAHDLRNPLNAISSYADLAIKFESPEREKFLQRVRQTTQKLYDLAGTLVDLAWVEAGMALEHRPFEMAHLIREVSNELAHEAQKRSITIVSSIQAPIPSVMGDPTRIKQAITALLTNAIRYSNPDSSVAIHAWQSGANVFCSVGDQGIGISEAEQAHIWDRMWRSSDERVRDISGGGIGLTFAKAIIKRHGGDIRCESKLDIGSTFTFMLPLAEGW
jgi:signal transduction histidine kinase